MRARIQFRSLVRYTLIAVFLAVFIGYVLWQARLLLTGPVVSLTNEVPEVSNERTIILSGTAANIVKITLNDRPIFTDKEGHFSEALVLENGYTIATLKGIDRYGRITTLTKGITYVHTATSSASTSPQL